jgi:hypothetical protein
MMGFNTQNVIQSETLTTSHLATKEVPHWITRVRQSPVTIPLPAHMLSSAKGDEQL